MTAVIEDIDLLLHLWMFIRLVTSRHADVRPNKHRNSREDPIDPLSTGQEITLRCYRKARNRVWSTRRSAISHELDRERSLLERGGGDGRRGS